MGESMAANAAVNRVAQTVHGVVSAIDPVNHAVKVLLQPENIESGWIADAACAQVGDIRIACPSCIGTHVVLQPLEGDGEHLVVVGVVYDAVVLPPVSPATNAVAQPGEILIMAGCGAPPRVGSESVGAGTASAGWWHLTRSGVFAGAGNARQSVVDGSVSWSVGSVSMRLSANGLSLDGGGVVASGDVVGESHSLASHVHPFGQGMTGSAVG